MGYLQDPFPLKGRTQLRLKPGGMSYKYAMEGPKTLRGTPPLLRIWRVSTGDTGRMTEPEDVEYFGKSPSESARPLLLGLTMHVSHMPDHHDPHAP